MPSQVRKPLPVDLVQCAFKVGNGFSRLVLVKEKFRWRQVLLTFQSQKNSRNAEQLHQQLSPLHILNHGLLLHSLHSTQINTQFIGQSLLTPVHTPTVYSNKTPMVHTLHLIGIHHPSPFCRIFTSNAVAAFTSSPHN